MRKMSKPALVLNSNAGDPSQPKFFAVSGNNLTAPANLQAPAGFELSSSINGPYTNSLSINPTAGEIQINKVYVRLSASNAVGNRLDSITLSATGAVTKKIAVSGTVAAAATGTGLQGVYYNGIAFAGTPLLTRIDPTINFELTYTHQPLSPAPGIVPDDNFSVRWTGQVKAQYSETYTFYTLSDDGIRLWVNGVQLVNNFVNQGATEKSGSIALVAGQKYDIVIEYFEGTGEAISKLSWSSASTAKAIVPSSQLFPPYTVSLPAPPSCVSLSLPRYGITVVGSTSAQLNWNPPMGSPASSYDVYLWKLGTASSTTPVGNTTGLAYNATGLEPGTPYRWNVIARNDGGTASGCAVDSTAFFYTAAATGGGTGLQGVYYNGTAFAGPPLLTRIDPTINFELTYAHQPMSPAPGIVPDDNFSVRWTGQVQPLFSDTYTFYTLSDDGIRLWVNGVQLVNNFVNQGATEKSGSISLVAGRKYDIVIEYFEGTGEAISKLYWSSTNTPKAIVPQSQLFPPNSGNPGAPGCAVNTSPANGSSISTETSATLIWNVVPTATSYDVYLAPVGVDFPFTPITVTTNTRNVTGLKTGTTYNWYVLPRNANGTASNCDVSNTSSFTTAAAPTAGNGTGLFAVYYNGTGLSGTPLLTRVDPTVNFELTYAHPPMSPAPGIVPDDNFSVRWSGKVQPLYSETYTFYTLSDDGITLWVNGVQLVNNFVNQGATEKSGSITLVAGQKYNIIIEYFEGTGDAVAKLYWSSPSTPKAIVPQSQLYPPFGDARIMDEALSVKTITNSNSASFTTATVAPNPVKRGQPVMLRVVSDRTIAATLSVLGSQGVRVRNQAINLVKGVNLTTIDTGNLAQGLYLLTVNNGSKPITMKLLVQ